MNKTLILITALNYFFLTSTANSDSITGNIEFNKRAPYTGLVYVKEVSHYKQLPFIDQKSKKFTKKLIVSSKGSLITFNNSDEFDHNIFSNDTKHNVKFDIGRMPAGKRKNITTNWEEDTIIRIGCKIHPKMRSYIANINSDIIQVLSFSKKIKNYSINLTNVENTSKQVGLLLPGYDSIIIDINKNETITMPLMRKGKNKGSITLIRK